MSAPTPKSSSPSASSKTHPTRTGAPPGSRCCECGAPEGPERCCWPLPDSPASFFEDSEWDDAFDREIVAYRIGGGEFLVNGVADILGISRCGVWACVKRGELARPIRYDPVRRNRDQAVWSAEQVAAALIRRGQVPA